MSFKVCCLPVVYLDALLLREHVLAVDRVMDEGGDQLLHQSLEVAAVLKF